MVIELKKSNPDIILGSSEPFNVEKQEGARKLSNNERTEVKNGISDQTSPSSVISPEFRPDAQGLSPAMVVETGAMTKDMLSRLINGEVNVADPDALTRAMIEMAKNKVEKNKN